MRRAVLLVCACCLAAAFAGAPGLAHSAAGASDGALNMPGEGDSGALTLTATDPSAPDYLPPFTGNGTLGVRVPPIGQGWASGAVPTTSQLGGFYAQPPGGVQQRATIPTWSTLTFADGGVPFSLSAGHLDRWQQTLDLRSGIVTTRAQWTAPDGHTTDLTYEVLTDRADAHLAAVRLTMKAEWSGTAVVTDVIDPTPATLTTVVGQGRQAAQRRDWLEVRADGTGTRAGVASQLAVGNEVGEVGSASTTPASGGQGGPEGVGQQATLKVVAGRPVQVTKYVAVVASTDGPASSMALSDVDEVARGGFDRMVRANDAAWDALWAGRIDVLGDSSLATDVNASEFALWASTRAGSSWSLTPGGLSSSGYNGHVFWDADTWMYPALLAQHPDLAVGVVEYRFARLGAARQHAAATGYQGARFPWESALDGTEQVPPPATVFTEGLYEQHVTADVGLAQWQYYLATGDRRWLAAVGWPVLSATADFWASRVTPSADVDRIDSVTGPDEENQDVDDEAYSVAAARKVLEDADEAAAVLGLSPPPAWSRVAAALVTPSLLSSGAVSEFDGYGGQMVKQADVTMLQYPWDASLPRSVEQSDVDYYAPRTDPQGPSMSDAVNAIDTALLDSPGCAAGVFTERSVDPFVHDVFDQFSETSTGGTVTFMTGIGGFLQEFLYGYSGLRFSANSVTLSPLLSSPLGGLVLHGVAWQGRRFTVAIGPRTTTITLTAGRVLPVLLPGGRGTVLPGHPLTVPTRRPDLMASPDQARCQGARATSAAPGGPPEAAVDGSAATGWQPETLPATLVVALRRGSGAIDSASVTWGQSYPRPAGLDVSPLPGPVTTLRAGTYTVSARESSGWRVVATVSGLTGTTDTIRFAPVTASAVALRLVTATGTALPVVDELSVSGEHRPRPVAAHRLGH